MVFDFQGYVFCTNTGVLLEVIVTIVMVSWFISLIYDVSNLLI